MIRCSFRNAWCQSMSSLAELMLFMSCVGVLFRTNFKTEHGAMMRALGVQRMKTISTLGLGYSQRCETTQFLIKDNADY